MLSGKGLCEFLLNQHQLIKGQDYEVKKTNKKFFGRNYSRVSFKTKGKTNVYLFEDNYDKGKIEHLLAASHEASHLLNYNGDKRRFVRLMWKQNIFLMFFAISVLNAILTLIHMINIPNSYLPGVIVFDALILISGYLYSIEYKKDEKMAEEKSEVLIQNFLNPAFVSENDPRAHQNLKSELDSEYAIRFKSIPFQANVRLGFAVILAMLNIAMTVY